MAVQGGDAGGAPDVNLELRVATWMRGTVRYLQQDVDATRAGGLDEG